MNYRLYIQYLILFFFLFAAAISCKDKCKDVICFNGYCEKGECICFDGYSGENCKIKESDKFAGNYTGKIVCDAITQPVKAGIINDFNSPRQIRILINNFSNTIDLKGHVLIDSIYIDSQSIEIIDSVIINGQIVYDTTINLIYPSSGILTNDSLLTFDLKMKGSAYLECDVILTK